MRRSCCWLSIFLFAFLIAASAPPVQAQAGGANIGYVYPAGGQRGTTFRVVVGGQQLRGADQVYVSGEGVKASVIQYVRPLGAQELSYTSSVMRELVRRRWSLNTMRYLATAEDAPTLPDHPWLRGLDQKSPAELARLRARLFDPRKQMNNQIAEQVEVEVTIAPDATPGDRDLRLASPNGLTNPLCFQVGVLPEVGEELATVPGQDAPEINVPVALNGQIQPGEVDRFRLRARKGQQLVLRLQAQHLIPYLADAVPGWFQATMALRDSQGREVAYGDDYRFDPDPVLFYKVPEDGAYDLEVRDSIYRGRDDFVYRVAVGELPFVTRVFPLGAASGVATTASVTGWNLPSTTVPLDTTPSGETLRKARISDKQGMYAELSYAVDRLPDTLEVEPNNGPEQAQAVTLPVIVNGRIGRPGDRDQFRFEARAGEELVVEVSARRLNSPLDSVLQIVDATGKVIAFNDDHQDPTLGLTTHQSDSYVRVKLPQGGLYRAVVYDAQDQGGDAFGYRLRLGPPQPDFAVRVTPSAINVRAGRPGVATAHVVRRDGFEGDIDIIAKSMPDGFTLSAARVPAGKDTVQLTVTAPRGAPRQIVPIQLEGKAHIGDIDVVRPAVPAEDLMQAFAYRHLVPQQELLVAVAGGGTRPVPAVWLPLVPGAQLVTPAPVRIPLGGNVQVQLKAPGLPTEAKLTLSSSSRGITLVNAAVTPAGIRLNFRGDPFLARAGQEGHLIIEARTPKGSLGVLPHIPFRVVYP
jgi:hypothetical protein